ncbi:MAG: trehalase [Flammeovirgaceae bacterium]|nr:trehalase [Flammeovirgaceae bacterium]
MRRLLLLLLVVSCSSAKDGPSYHSGYKEHWENVAFTIQETWHLSKVDSSTWQMTGSLNVPYPFMSIKPGRNVLFGWDPYFTNLGLLTVDSLAIYAKNSADNQMEEIDQVGYIPNASEPWALNRSQPPFLAMKVKDVYETINPGKDWLMQSYDAIVKEYQFWMDSSETAIEDNTTSIDGLQRYYHHATDDELIAFYSQLAPRFGFSDTIPRSEQIAIGSVWMAEAESGMDFTPRFENRCPDFIPVDLNSNLYQYEQILSWMVKELDLSDQPDWQMRANKRKVLINQYCWSEERGMYLDYDFVNQRHSEVASSVSFYPLWAGIASREQAQKVRDNLGLIEFEFGPTVCEPTKQDRHYQWDYPAGWPPLYYIVASGLEAYGDHEDALRIASKYLDIVTKNYLSPEPQVYVQTNKKGAEVSITRKPGFVYEKYNVLDGTVNDSEYAGREFQGWSYGVYMWAYDFVTTK